MMASLVSSSSLLGQGFVYFHKGWIIFIADGADRGNFSSAFIDINFLFLITRWFYLNAKLLGSLVTISSNFIFLSTIMIHESNEK